MSINTCTSYNNRNNEPFHSISYQNLEVRVWVDGCFDLPHYGHAVFLYRAKSFGNFLVVGVHKDSDVKTDKGIVFTPHKDRIKMIKAMKWVDEVVEFPPTKASLETLDSHGCEFCVHGDDQIIDKYGVDSYAYAKNAGRYQEVRRCPGVSTTHMIERILWIADQITDDNRILSAEQDCNDINPQSMSEDWAKTELLQELKRFTAYNEPKENDKVVYTSGSFDLFHIGHVDFLEKCKQQDDYLIVGIHDDDVVSQYEGKYFPITTLHGRVLAVSSCRYVDRVVVGVPHIVTAEMIVDYKIDFVTHGMTDISSTKDGQDPYAEPKSRGIFSLIDSGSEFNLTTIIERAILDKTDLKERNLKKKKAFHN